MNIELVKEFQGILGYFLGDRRLINFFQYRPENKKAEVVIEKVNALWDKELRHAEGSNEMAGHIMNLGIDRSLESGDLNIVPEISNLQPEINNGRYLYFSSRYCAFHCPYVFPIWDLRTATVLRYYLKRNGEKSTPIKILNDYKRYEMVLSQFRHAYDIEFLNYPEMNKFFWIYHDELINAFTENHRSNLDQ